MYDFMKNRFSERGDNDKLKKLDACIEVAEDGIHCKDWGTYVSLVHDAGGGTVLDQTEFTGVVLPILFSHCYTIPEKLHYVPSLKMYRETTFSKENTNYDYREELNEFEIPIYFLSGEYDYNCPWPLVEDYCDELSAPDKKFYKISNAAHSPLWENAQDSYDAMMEIKAKCGF